MATRTASCNCGKLSVSYEGPDPERISLCQCYECQKRTGSVLSVQARVPRELVTIEGQSTTWTFPSEGGEPVTFRSCDSGGATYHFCPECGSTVHFRIEGKFDGLVAIPLGAFDDPFSLEPRFSVWEKRKHDWVAIVGDDVEHMD